MVHLILNNTKHQLPSWCFFICIQF